MQCRAPPLELRSLRFAALLWVGACAGFLAAAVDPTVRVRFDVPAGAARPALRVFAAQARVDLIVPSNVVRGIATRSVQGEFTVQEALAVMLGGTGLAADIDPRSGAVAIRASREPVSPPSRVATTRTSPMEPVELSAFTVRSSTQVGYRALNTLAGTRLNTPLRDVGTSISVVTRELLDDLAATDTGMLLAYTAGTEIGGVHGNFAGGSFGAWRADQNEARVLPDRNQRVRGLAAAEQTRDYFLTDVPFDAYNTEQVTINRGPNALLFGIGSPGGVINQGTITPLFAGDFHEMRIAVAPRGSQRETLESNHVIVQGRLAVRLAALHEERQFRQRPAWERDRRGFLALAGVLAENRRSEVLGPTLLRANVERGKLRGNPPNVLPPNDGFSSWWSLPSVELERFTGTTFPAYYRDGSFIPQRTIDNRAGNLLASGPFASPYFLHLALIYTAPGGPGFGFPDHEAPAGGQGRILYTSIADGRPQMNQIAARHSYSGSGFRGFRIPSLQDRKVFDFYNQLYTGATSLAEREFDTSTLALEQGFWRGRAGIEFVHDRQRSRTWSFLPWGAGEDSGTGHADVLVDVSRFASNDAANPNVGRPFLRTIALNDNEELRERASTRITSFATLDAKEHFSGGRAGRLGRHVLTGMWSRQTLLTTSRTHGLGWDSEHVDLTTLLGGAIQHYRRQVVPIAYIGPSLLGTARPEDVRLQAIDVRLPRSGDRHMLFYFDPASGAVRDGEFIARRYLAEGALERRKIDSRVASLQSYLADEHLIALVGLRRDRQNLYERVNYDSDADPVTSDRLPAGDFNPGALQLRREPTQVVTSEMLTTSLVARLPSQDWQQRVGLADARVFFNRSENISPVQTRRDVFNVPLGPPTSDTRELGVSLEFAKGRIGLRANVFRTRGRGFTYDGLASAANWAVSLAGDWLNRLIEAERQGVAFAQTAFANAGFTSFADVEREVVGLFPEPTRSQTQYRVERGAGPPSVMGNRLVGVVATSDFVARGWELEFVGNPWDGLRTMLNVSRQQTVQSSIAPELRRLVRQTIAAIEASPLRDLPDSPALGEPSTYFGRYSERVTGPLAAEIAREGTRSLEQRELRVNVVASYAFRERLKGWGIGAGVRWQSAASTGYPTFIGPDGMAVPDLSRPFFSESETNADLWLSRERKVWGGRVGWKTQLNIRNAIGSSEPITVFTNPDGRVAIVRVPPPTEWVLTTAFRF